MKILLINASPRKNGNTKQVLSFLAKQLKNQNITIINLIDFNIQRCRGCNICEKRKNHSCVITNDDVNKITNYILKANVFVIAFPSYFSNIPGILKDFIDRTNPYYFLKTLKGKKGAVICQGEYKLRTIKVGADSIGPFFRAHKIKNIGTVYFGMQNFHSKKIKNQITKLASKIKG